MRTAFFRLLSVAIALCTPIAGAADSLGEGLHPPLFRTLSGIVVSVSEDATLVLRWFNPRTNRTEWIEIRQRNALGFPPEMAELVLDERVACGVMLETNRTLYVNCSVADRSTGPLLPPRLLDILLAYAPELIGCSEEERADFRDNGREECVIDTVD